MVSLAKRCCAEIIGTFLLVFFGAGAAAMTLMLARGSDAATPFNNCLLTSGFCRREVHL